MKQKFRMLFLCFPMLLLMLFCTGCFGSFDAGEYVQAVLDNLYLDDSAALLEIADISAGDAHNDYLNGLSTETQIFYGYLNFNSIAIDDQTTERVMNLYKEIYSHARYEIESTKKTKDGYSVVVRIYPIDFFVQAMEELNAYVDSFYGKIAGGEYLDWTEQEINADFQDAMLQILESKTDSIGYLDPVEQTVLVKKDSEDKWGMSNEDFQAIDTDIIRY